jgi:hypothetical protein
MNKERELEMRILLYCNDMPGVVGMREVKNPKAVARGYSVALMRLDTWSSPWSDDGMPVPGIVIKASESWETLADELGLSIESEGTNGS